MGTGGADDVSPAVEVEYNAAFVHSLSSDPFGSNAAYAYPSIPCVNVEFEVVHHLFKGAPSAFRGALRII